MKSSLESHSPQSPLMRKLNIEVPAAEVQAAFDRALKGVQKEVAVKGFRKGKAPLGTIRSLYGERLKQDVIQEIIQTHYVSALQQHSLEPINYPTIEFDPMEDEQDFAFTAEFEVRPDVKLVQIDGLRVKREKLELNDKLVDETLEDIRKSRAETVPVLEDRAAQNGDIAVIDFKGFVDGHELENGAGQDVSLDLGSNSFIPGFEDGVIGMRPGVTSTLKLKFPADYHAAEIAGKDVEFNVTLKSLKKKSLPELNDEFVKALGPYENLEGLKKSIRDDFEKREAKRVHDDLKNRLMKALVDKNPVQVPKSMMVDQKKALIEDFQERMKQQGMAEEQFEDYKSKWDQDFEQTASYMIQSSFLIDKLATDHNLRATAGDIDAKLKEYGKTTGIEMSRLYEFYGDKDRRARLSYQITEEKVLDFLISKAKIDEVTRAEIEKDQAN
jgi:trigger factor